MRKPVMQSGLLTQGQCEDKLRLWDPLICPGTPGFLSHLQRKGFLIDRAAVVPWLISFVERVGCALGDQSLLYVHEFGVWPEVNAYETFHFIRLAEGHKEPVNTHPGQWIDPTSKYAQALIHIGLVSEWDVCLLSWEPKSLIFASHDGWIAFLPGDSPSFEPIRETFHGIGIDL